MFVLVHLMIVVNFLVLVELSSNLQVLLGVPFSATIVPSDSNLRYFFNRITLNAFSLNWGKSGNPSLYGSGPEFFSAQSINSVTF